VTVGACATVVVGGVPVTFEGLFTSVVFVAMVTRCSQFMGFIL
jgi:hypothetical protein